MSSKIKAVIFDMDGVLIDAKDWHYEALNKALRLFGLDITRAEHETTYDGLPTKDKLEILSREKGLSRSLHSFINEIKQQYTMEMVNNLCRPIFHHEYLLSKLHQQGYKLSVASNSITNTVSVMMDHAHLKQYLEFFISNEDVKNGKPDPEMYTLSIKKLGLTPEECLIIEDNENGLKAAYASGAHVLKVETVFDVNYDNINQRIQELEGCK
jgi:beta-phosphoglucomutase